MVSLCLSFCLKMSPQSSEVLQTTRGCDLVAGEARHHSWSSLCFVRVLLRGVGIQPGAWHEAHMLFCAPGATAQLCTPII